MVTNKRTLLIIPAYNEEESIEKTILSIQNFKDEYPEELNLDYIVVNDGSK